MGPATFAVSRSKRFKTKLFLHIGLLMIILFVATGLRVWRLDEYGLWWDEGNNAYFAYQNMTGLLEASRLTHDTNLPAHRLTLAIWLRILGNSVFNARLLSRLWRAHSLAGLRLGAPAERQHGRLAGRPAGRPCTHGYLSQS